MPRPPAPPGKGGLGVNLAQGEIAVDRGEQQGVFQAAQFRQEPLVTLTGVSLHADPVLGDEHVLAQGCQSAVTRELVASVVGLGRRRKDLDDDGRVEQRVQFAVFESQLAADDHDVGVRVQAARTDVDAHVVDVGLAGTIPELRTDFAAYVERDQVVAALERSEGLGGGPRSTPGAARDVVAPESRGGAAPGLVPGTALGGEFGGGEGWPRVAECESRSWDERWRRRARMRSTEAGGRCALPTRPTV
jgi:hypothetical protein